MFVGGLDIGTTGAKLAIYNEKVKLFDTFYIGYDVKRVNGNDEICFKTIFEKVLSLLKQASENYLIDAIAVTTFGESFTMLDENDNILTPTMLYTDSRGENEIKEIVNVLGEKKIALKTGVKPHAMYSLAKVLWIKHNMSDAYNKAKRILLGQDYIVYMLSGVAQIDYSLAERTQYFNIESKKYDDEILEIAGIDKSLLSKPVEMGTLAGKIKLELAKKYNLNANMLIYNGCHDQIANMFGSGVFDEFTAMDGSGTIECLCAVLTKIPDYDFFEKGYCLVPYLNNTYATYAFSYGGCCCIKEFKEKYALNELRYCEENNIDFYSHFESNFKKELTDLFILPYFTGAGTPYMDQNVKGSVINMSFETTIYDLYQSLLESISFELRVNYDALCEYGVNIKSVKACGGGSNSKLWVQMKSDVLNVSFKRLDCKEIGCAGTVLILLKSMNLIDDIYEGYKLLNIEKETINPSFEKHKLYLKKYDRYKNIYKTIKNI